MMGLLVFQIDESYGRYIDPDQQGDNSYKNCMNWYKNHIVYEFVLYNLYNNCMNYFV